MFGRKKNQPNTLEKKEKKTETAATPKRSKDKSSKETANQQKQQIERLPAEPPEEQKQEQKQQEKKLSMKDVSLRPIREDEELKLAMALWSGEEWRMSMSDLRDLLEMYPQCLWGAFSSTSGKLMGCCLASPMDANTAFISSLVTHPQHRRKGVATLVFNRAIKSVGERKLLLSVTAEMEDVMERWRYHFSRHHICSCDGRPRLPENYTPPSSISIQQITFENLGDVLEFDQSVCGIDRSHTFRSFLKSGNTLGGLCAVVGGKLDGFAFLRKESETSVRISAFYAENYETARALLYELVRKFVQPGTELVTWFSIVNMDRCRKLYREFGMDDPESQFRLMYSDEDVNVPWYKVYGIYEHYANLV